MYSYLIRFTGEIWIKWAKTRWNYIRKLSSNIEKAVGDNLVDIKYSFDKIVLHTEANVDNKLANVFWIAKFSKFKYYKFENIDDLLEYGENFYKNTVSWKKFAVRVNRIGEHTFKAMDLEKSLWAKLYKYSSWVNLKNPDVWVKLEIYYDYAYFLEYTKEWAWWFPIWSVWRIPVLFSWWIDSSVAVWYLFRMWFDLDLIYFDLWWDKPFEASFDTAKYMYSNFWYWSKMSFYKVDFKDLIWLLSWIKQSYQVLALKYYFYKFTELFCNLSSYNWFATWEAINQVSTQVFKNLYVLDNCTDKFVIRPLICLPKQDIMNIAKNIWSFELSYKWEEFCSISSTKVETDANINKLKNEIQKLDFDIEVLLEKTEKIDFKNKEKSSYFTKDIVDREIIYIQRNPSDFSDKYKNVLFKYYKNELSKLDKSKKYFIICKKWKLSNIVYSYMKENWFDVIY